jgi:ParB family chromosome partitioning protein
MYGMADDIRPPGAGRQVAESRFPGRGLGRGLGALIPRGQAGLQQIELTLIAPNPQQPRLRLDETGLAELAESVRQHGILQPVVVARVQDGSGYILVAGERRWRAAQLAGLESIPAIVKEAAPRQRLELALVENLQREDLAPLEMASAYRALIDEHGMTQEQVAQRVGKSRVAVANTLRLLQLPLKAREALVAGRISEGHARALLGAASESALLAALGEVLERGLSVRQTEELTRRNMGTASLVEPRRWDTDEESDSPNMRRLKSDGSAETAYLEERFRQALGTRVQLVRARRGGRLIVHFYSDDELDGIYQVIVGDPSSEAEEANLPR